MIRITTLFLTVALLTSCGKNTKTPQILNTEIQSRNLLTELDEMEVHLYENALAFDCIFWDQNQMWYCGIDRDLYSERVLRGVEAGDFDTEKKELDFYKKMLDLLIMYEALIEYFFEEITISDKYGNSDDLRADDLSSYSHYVRIITEVRVIIRMFKEQIDQRSFI
jgi:hypothetical protein